MRIMNKEEALRIIKYIKKDIKKIKKYYILNNEKFFLTKVNDENLMEVMVINLILKYQTDNEFNNIIEIFKQMENNIKETNN